MSEANAEIRCAICNCVVFVGPANLAESFMGSLCDQCVEKARIAWHRREQERSRCKVCGEQGEYYFAFCPNCGSKLE